MTDAAGFAPPEECRPPLVPSLKGGWDLLLDLGSLTKPLDVAAPFGRDAPFEIEVGTGSGYFLSRYARDHAGVNILGIDQAPSEARRSADKCRRMGLLNVRVVQCDALNFLEDFIPPASVERYHIYYSDPWPKTRHKKRRLWQPRLIAILERTLKPGGELLMKTDVTEYFTGIDRLLRGATGLTLQDDRRLDQEPLEGDYETNFQRKAIEQGHPLHYQRWQRS